MGRKKAEPLIRPNQRVPEILPTWDENYEESLRKSLFEDDVPDEDETENAENFNTDTWAHHERPGEEWDVPITEEIKYFDPELSYELTGYRPITMEKGLDFNPAPFIECANYYNRNGKYTEYPIKSKPWRDFWTEQRIRCEEGYKIGKYRLPGDYYFFLNFYRMMTAVERAKAGQGRLEAFPSFAAKQYEWFHYVEMCELLQKDIVALKGRGVGWSEIAANMAVRPYTTNKRYRTLLTCAAETKLDPLRNKCWIQLNFLDMHTQEGFKHLRQVKNSWAVKRASMLTSAGEEWGPLSEIDSVVADDPQKIRGDRTDRLIYEEAGSNKKLIASWVQGDSLIWLGGVKVGTKIAFGTGGDDMALGGLSDIFTNPDAYNVLPYKNYDTDSDKPELTGFFLPSHKFSLSKEYLDDRGVTDHVRFKEFYIEKRKKLTEKALIDECAEHCFTPREALIKHGDNMFNAECLSQRMMQLQIQKLGKKITPMQLLWDKTAGTGMEKVNAFESKDSKLLVVEPPLVDEKGVPYKDLYVAGIDSIDMGQNDSASTYDVSDFCIVIKKRIFGMDEPRIVAMYKDRPKDIRIAYDVAIKLLVWYNCKAMLEYTKISIIQYFTEKKKQHLFMSRPAFAVGNASATGRRAAQGRRLIGVPSTMPVISHGLELVSNFIEDYWYTIDYPEIVDQMLNYTLEEKRKFDCIAALQMVEIGDEAMTGVQPSLADKTKKEWRDFGWYTDDNGHKQYGIIPVNNGNWWTT